MLGHCHVFVRSLKGGSLLVIVAFNLPKHLINGIPIPPGDILPNGVTLFLRILQRGLLHLVRSWYQSRGERRCAE